MKLKKCIAVIIIGIMVIGMCAGCAKEEKEVKESENNSVSQPSQASSKAEKLMIRYVIPGSEPNETNEVVKCINEKMENDGLNLKLKLNYIPWDVWEQRTNLMLSTGEEFELFQIMEDQHGFTDYVGRGALVPLNEYIDSYGENLKKVIPDWVWDAAKNNDKIYTIPAWWTETTKGSTGLTIRIDQLEKNNLEVPKTPEQLLDAAEIIQKNWDGEGKPYILPNYTEQPRFLHRTYSSYPFTIFEQMLYIDQEGNVKSYIETEEFKKDASFFRDAFKRGLIHPDILTLPPEWATNEQEQVRYLFYDGFRLGKLFARENTDIKEDIIFFNEEVPNLRDMAFRNDNAVPTTTKHPEAAVQFLNWVYSNQDNYDLFLYGIKDKHWQEAGEKKMKPILNSEDQISYNFADWMVGNLNYMRFRFDDHPAKIKVMSTYDKDAVNSVIVGFAFDPTPVAVEYANCLAEVKSTLYPIAAGLTDYDKNIDNAIKKFKAAGIDKVVAEYEKQLKTWMQNK